MSAYLAARGLPLRFVDTQGSTASFLQASADAWPQADVVLVHAIGGRPVPACFAQADRSRCAAPLVLADERPVSVTHAYAAIKLLSQRGRQPVCDLLLSAAVDSRAPSASRSSSPAVPMNSSVRRCANACASIPRPTPTSRRPPRCGAGRGRWSRADELTPAAAAVAARAGRATRVAVGDDARLPGHRSRDGPELIPELRMYTAKGRLDVNTMLKQYSPLVRRLAHQMIAKLPANVEIDDLIQVGMIGLTDALSRFDIGQGVQFETFATQRIRGAMLDELRGNDYLSRGTRKQQRSIESAVHKLEQKLGRAPQESEIAAEMGLDLVEYQELLGKVRGTQLVYLEDMSGDDGDNDFLDRHVADEGLNPLAQLQDHRMRQALVDAIKLLPEREQFVMSMYYEQDMNLKEIAAVLKVTESRVCQLHSQSIARLRVKLREY